ncbi:bifunctional alpha/beta hydrolase/OsmC family protein [Marinobacterium rhizophilum]|uniref:OsmC family protein n=1 Tax=Marinobacterium rhizophilum TaxID=420402 RepID=A0ABY5HJR5_9GAMM|nr:bifunctional alpha/beta hydrolase/OsmC family protein [Marinobacterium rhizophilum]UTW12533.1 OsmC family protein [Marinobacterium rhizophilum]
MAAQRTRLNFPSKGVELSGLLEIPAQGSRGFVLFAHCFTCGKDIAAASRIARELTGRGFAVLRFDFTGLGNSDGDFANSNFSSNVDDLVAAADYLRDHYEAPRLLIGHSLGGRAVLSAAHRIAETAAVVTLGAPADARHVIRQFAAQVEGIESSGEAQVSLGGRAFSIRKQFLDDLSQDNDDIERLRTPLLVMHSPLDSTVSISQAEQIYRRAKHPKSFVSLDTADHLLSRREDTAYAASVIGAWSEKYLTPVPQVATRDSGTRNGEVEIREHNHRFTRRVNSDHHQWLADEPLKAGGDNLGPDPYEHLLAALGTCTSMTLRMYANHKKIPLDDVQVSLSHSRQHREDCEGCTDSDSRIEVLQRRIRLKGDLSEAQRQRLLEIADRCPVHKTLEGPLKVGTLLVD